MRNPISRRLSVCVPMLVTLVLGPPAAGLAEQSQTPSPSSAPTTQPGPAAPAAPPSPDVPSIETLQGRA